MGLLDWLYIALAVSTFITGFAAAKIFTKKEKKDPIGTITIVYDDQTGETYAKLALTTATPPTIGYHDILVSEEHIVLKKE